MYLVDQSENFTQDFYINLSNEIGTEVDLTPVSFTDQSYVVLPCKAGDKFVITGSTSTNARSWGFTDTEYVLKRVAAGNTVSPSRERELIAQEDGYFIANHNVTSSVGYSLIATQLIKAASQDDITALNDTLTAKDTEIEAEIADLTAQITAGKLESTGDSTDRTAEIRAKLTANGYCELGDGEFVVANLEMPAGTELRGQGYATVLKLDTSLTSGAAVIVNTNCTLKDMSIVGADANITFTSESTAGNRHGIRRSYRRTYNVNISNVRVRYFDGYGLYDANGGTPVQGNDDTQHGGMNVANCFFDGCFACLYIQSASNTFTNCECANGFYGAYTYAHGNVFTNCVFLGNLTDAYVKSSGATFVGCLFRKETSTVEGDALAVIDVVNMPLKAVGCTFDHCGGIRVATTDSRITACMALFDGCEFYDMLLPIVCTSGRGILFNGCMFYEDVTASGNIEETTAGAVKLNNCYRITTGALLER